VARTASSPSFLRRVAVTASAVAFLSTAFGSTQASASTQGATINTFKDWNGSDFVFPFGCANTTTYGQVITVPAGKTLLNRFVFSWEYYSGSGSMVVRGEVYAWDGTKATGASLFESAPRTIAFGNPIFHRVGFTPNGISVTPGAQYVLFASIDKDFEECTDSYQVAWGTVSDDAYGPGTFVYENNGGDESQWTSPAWTTTYGSDLAFKAFLS
jgi:hypothetical protein